MAKQTHTDLSPRYIHDSYNMALTTLGGKARNGAVNVKCITEPIIAEHSFSSHVAWGKSPRNVNIHVSTWMPGSDFTTVTAITTEF